jgi:hypothetical protein
MQAFLLGFPWYTDTDPTRFCVTYMRAHMFVSEQAGDRVFGRMRPMASGIAEYGNYTMNRAMNTLTLLPLIFKVET